jgi:hypothetical protein
MNNREIVTIESVDIVSGESIKPVYVEARWQSKMQKIHVKEKAAYFIENMEGNSFSRSSTAWRGIDMKPYVGKKVLIEKYDVNFHPRENGLWMKFIKVI